MLDHLVYATPDLARTAEFMHMSGSPLVEGGPHVGLGTRNCLGSLGRGRYLEVVGPDPEQPPPDGARPFGIDTLAAERLVTWAVRVPDLDAALAAARAAGHDPGEARPMSRRRPDGELLSWRLAFPPDDLGGVMPFLIDWGDTAHPSTTLPRTRYPLDHLILDTPHERRVRDVLEAVGADALDLVTVRERPVPSLNALLSDGTVLH